MVGWELTHDIVLKPRDAGDDEEGIHKKHAIPFIVHFFAKVIERFDGVLCSSTTTASDMIA